jgi:hypothetical protein
MIEFSCHQCRNELKVEDSKAGAKGKCPRCNTILTVPIISAPSNQLIFVDNDNFFTDNRLNRLYKTFLNTKNDSIYGHQVSTEKWGDSARFEIATTRGRSQIIWLMNQISSDDGSWIAVFSVVGEVTTKDAAVHALRSVEMFAPYNIRLDDDNYLVLSALAKISNLDQDLFNTTLMMVALKADELEKVLFGVDRL